MKSINLNIDGSTWLLVAIIVFLINQLPFLSDMRPVMYDEGWYGSTAYNFAHGQGFLNTVVGTRGNSNFLLPMLTGFVMKVMGYNILSLRLTAVLCGIVTLIFIGLCMKQMKVSVLAQSLTYLLFVSLTVYNTIFRFGRPECAAVMMTAGGVWMYLRYRDSSNWQNMLGLSICAMLACTAHPYALLLFALMGAYLLFRDIHCNDWHGVSRLTMLMIGALLGLAAVAWVSKTYNVADEDYMSTRFSVKGVFDAVPLYFKGALLDKHALYMIPFLIMLFYLVWRDKEHRVLAGITLVYFSVFPFLFSTDLMMVGLGCDYVAIVATILFGAFADKLCVKRWPQICVLIYCVANLSINYYYNYGKKFERVNTLMTSEMQAIVPDGSKVFGPIRQWPMLMNTDYQSDHTCYPVMAQDDCDFIILNSQDAARYNTYNYIMPINDSIMELVYERDTKQYGVVQIYKHK